MLNSNTKDAEDLRIYQIIDANLDRAREGLRVLEDWARFGLGKEEYVEKIKNFRQILGKNHLEVYKQSRNHNEDKCKGLTCLLYTSPSPRDISGSRMPSSA